MAAGRIVHESRMPALDLNGLPVSGARLYLKVNKTTELTSIYADAALSVPLTNPVIADAQGAWPDMWAEAGETGYPVLYTVSYEDGDGAPLGKTHTYDDFRPSAKYDAAESAAQAAAALEEAETALSQTQLARNVAQAAADEAANENGLAQLAAQNAIAASLAANYYPAAQSYVPQGAVGHGSITGGSGGTNGTFDAILTGGNFSADPKVRFTVAGGVLSSITIDEKGLYVGAAPSPPSLDLSASSGLSGASASLTVGVLVQSGETYWTDHASDVTMASLYLNVAGTATATSPLVTFPKTLGLFANGGLGQVLADPTANIYLDRPALSDQPRSALDLTVDANVQFLTQNVLSNPATRFAAAVVSGVREVTFNWNNFFPVAAFSGRRAVGVGMIHAVEAEFIQATGTAGNIGVGIAFTTTAPTLGGASGNMATNARLIMIRSNGAPVVTQSDGFTTAGDITKTTIEISLGWSVGQRISVQYEPTVTNGSKGFVRFFTDGEPNGLIYVEGVQANPYFGLVCRSSAVVGDKARYYSQETYAPSLDVPRDLTLDPAASVGGKGTDADPFGTGRELAMAIYRDRARRKFRIHLKGGVWDDFSLTPPVATQFEVYPQPGTELHGSVPIPTNAGWVNITGEVWELANPADLIGIGGLVQTDRPSTFGLNGKTTVDYSLYARRAPDYAPASLKRGEMSAHFSGTHDGHLLVRCWDGSNPNDHTWRFTTRFAVIDARFCQRLTIKPGLTIAGGYSYGIWGDTTDYDLDGVRIRQIMVGNGLQCKDCSGTVRNLVVEGCLFDLIHWNDSTLPLGERPVLTFIGGSASGAFYYDDGAGFLIIADAMSNHKGNAASFTDFTFRSAGKAGAATSGDVSFTNCPLDDNRDAGVILYAESGELDLRKVTINSGPITGNGSGILVTGASYEGVTLNLEANGVLFGGQANRNVETYSTAISKTITATLTGCERTDTPPNADSVAAGTTLNVLPTVAY